VTSKHCFELELNEAECSTNKITPIRRSADTLSAFVDPVFSNLEKVFNETASRLDEGSKVNQRNVAIAL